MDPGPVQMASSLTETFYDLNTSSIRPVYPQPTYPPAPPPSQQCVPPPPASLWSPRVEGYGGGLGGGYLSGGILRQEDLTVGGGAVCSVVVRGGAGDVGSDENSHGGHTPVPGEWAEDEDEGEEEGSKDGDRTGENSSHKHSQVAATLTWLTDNYERAEGVCLPRCVLYTHYLDFCKKHDFTPAGAATFGKIIRQKFPKLTTRRLGTRGQSKYHYYGIGIKETSVYYHSVYSGRGLTRFSGVKVKTEGSNRKYSLSSKTGTLLPEFPNVENLILPDDVSSDKMQTLLMMYRTHCQRILDTIISANFDEVQNLLLHFWQGMPTHLTDMLTADILCDMVALCDSILYKVLADVLLPSAIQDMPDSLGMEIKVLARKLPAWLLSALDSVPQRLVDRKMEAARNFARSVTRQLSFVHLAQTARTTLSNQEEVMQMTSDLDQVDFGQVLCQAFYTLPTIAKTHRDVITAFFGEFHSLLQKQASVESYTEWIDNVVDTCVLQPSKAKGQGFRDSAADFLMQWALLGSLLMKDLTLLNCRSFGSFHLLHIMLDEYVYLVMETQRDQARELHIQRHVQRHMRNAEVIKTQAKLRTGTNKMAASSPKNRKRKQEDHPDSTDEMEMTSQTHDARMDGVNVAAGREGACLGDTPPSLNPAYQPHVSTAFTRPQPSIPRDSIFGNNQSEVDSERSAHAYPTLPVSPVKALSSVNGGAAYAERSAYLSQFGLDSYSDYVTRNSALTSSRVQNYPEHHAHGQTFSSVPFTGGGGGLPGTYWADSRTHPTVLAADPYSQYAGHSMTSAYDSAYKNAALLRGSVYGQEAALGLNTARGYFSARASDTYQGSSLAVGSGYGGNFMEIAPSGAQYPRPHDTLPAYQDDLYASGMASTLPAFHKHYLASSFR